MIDKRKKILLVFHLNFLKRNMGCSNAVYHPIKILKSMGFLIDFFTMDLMDNFSDFDYYNTENIINKLYLVQRNKNEKRQTFLSRIINKLRRILKLSPKNSRKYYSNTYISDIELEKFQKIINSTYYDYIYVHYCQWTDLFRYCKIPDSTKIIYNMHDIDFIQCFYHGKILDIGKRFEEELDMLKYYHKILCVSYDEMLFFSRFFTEKKFYFLPPIDPAPPCPSLSKDIDVLFIGANNIFNVEAAQWFLDKILPLIAKDISITFCGKFLSALSVDYSKKIQENNITIINFAENIESLYAKTKIVVVPMLSGTGIKIKTLEAMSYSIPVVSTELGVDGFPDKYENGCLVSDIPSVFASNIMKLLNDSNYYEKTQKKQDCYFAKHFSPKENFNTLKEVFGD